MLFTRATGVSSRPPTQTMLFTRATGVSGRPPPTINHSLSILNTVLKLVLESQQRQSDQTVTGCNTWKHVFRCSLVHKIDEHQRLLNLPQILFQNSLASIPQHISQMGHNASVGTVPVYTRTPARRMAAATVDHNCKELMTGSETIWSNFARTSGRRTLT